MGVVSAPHRALSAPPGDQWWRRAVLYQVYPRSFADSDGDGMGDLPGLIARLGHIRDLGVDGIWVSPFYVSPQADAGYDVADYRDVDPMFGTLADAEELIRTSHAMGLRVVVDLVPNHTSDHHAWFRAALAAGRGGPERAWYVFRDGRGPTGDEPPNNWRSVFGGPAWTRVAELDGQPGQWYLHLFDAGQPDLDWDHPEVRAEFCAILRFWLDRGVDGFRVDVAHGLVKAPGLPDWDHDLELLDGGTTGGERPPMWDQDGVHAIYRGWRRVIDEYGGDRMLVAEAWVEPPERLARYVRPDEMHQAFNFDFLVAHWDAAALRRAIVESLEADALVGAPTTWVLSNHDVVRPATRLAMPPTRAGHHPDGVRASDPQPSYAVGLRRARAAMALMLALPGSAYLYQGEELGLPDHTTLADTERQDPAFVCTAGRIVGRDGCRVPMPWSAGKLGLGFGPTGATWLPQPEVYVDLAVDRQDGVADSTLELCRTLLRLRRDLGLGSGEIAFPAADDPAVLRVRRILGGACVEVVVNLGPDPVALPQGVVLTATGPLEERRLPTDTTAWVRCDT